MKQLALQSIESETDTKHIIATRLLLPDDGDVIMFEVSGGGRYFKVSVPSDEILRLSNWMLSDLRRAVVNEP